MNAKLVWLREKYNYGSQTHIGGSSSQTDEICDVYLTEKELHQLHLDEETLRETLEEEAMDEKERGEKIKEKQADNELFMLEFRVKYDSEYEDSTMTMKNLSGTIPKTIHHKVIGKGSYGKEIIVGAALILANVLVFSPKPSMHYLNITMRNVVKVFRKNTIPESGSG
nr:hypothetical protein [Tanacetum cinerariifolium]